MYAAVPTTTPSRVAATVAVPQMRSRRGVLDDRLREPEIEHLDETVPRHLDVGWLQIAVNDAFVVNRLERGGHLAGDPEHIGNGERPTHEAIGEGIARVRSP